MGTTPTLLPLDEEAYLPDKEEPVDRWFQAGNSGNAQTVRTLISDMAPDAVCVIDPFAGAGSTAVAARCLRKPFFGIEQHPVLAAACLAKQRTTQRHARLLGETPSTDDTTALGQALIDIRNRADGTAVRDLSALAIICYLSASKGRPLTAEALTADLASIPRPRPAGRVVCGDCTTPEAWHLARIPRQRSVLYTSPPFGARSPKPGTPPAVEESAVELLRSANLLSDSSASPFTSYTELTLGMLRQALPYLERSVVIIECEPADDKSDQVEGLLDRIMDEFGAIVRQVRLFDCGSFSERGRFSLLVFDV
jgi:DNA methylase